MPEAFFILVEKDSSGATFYYQFWNPTSFTPCMTASKIDALKMNSEDTEKVKDRLTSIGIRVESEKVE